MLFLPEILHEVADRTSDFLPKVYPISIKVLERVAKLPCIYAWLEAVSAAGL